MFLVTIGAVEGYCKTKEELEDFLVRPGNEAAIWKPLFPLDLHAGECKTRWTVYWLLDAQRWETEEESVPVEEVLVSDARFTRYYANIEGLDFILNAVLAGSSNSLEEAQQKVAEYLGSQYQAASRMRGERTKED